MGDGCSTAYHVLPGHIYELSMKTGHPALVRLRQKFDGLATDDDDPDSCLWAFAGAGERDLSASSRRCATRSIWQAAVSILIIGSNGQPGRLGSELQQTMRCIAGRVKELLRRPQDDGCSGEGER